MGGPGRQGRCAPCISRWRVSAPRYQRQLSLAVEREQSLEREKVQLGLDWQHRCDSVERDHYQKSEELVRGLTTAKEQVRAPLTSCGGPGTAPHSHPPGVRRVLSRAPTLPRPLPGSRRRSGSCVTRRRC